MRHPAVLALAGLAIGYLYLGVLAYAIAFAAVMPPQWWIAAFSSSGTSVLSWSTFAHSVAVVLASIPFAWVIVWLYGRFSLYAATAIGVATWLVLEIQFVIDAFYFPRFLSIWFADTLVFVLALPLLAWLFRKLPSNNRWRGP
jgi:hypothetical protein